MRKYDNNTQQLINKVFALAPTPGNEVFPYLKKLERKAKQLKAKELLGILYYAYAITYSYHENHEACISNLMKAVSYLLRSNEQYFLARTYNLFAVEAQKQGCFDIAFSYYNLALSVIEEDEPTISYAIIKSNVGDLFAMMGDFKIACTYVRSAYNIAKKFKKDPMYNQTIALTLIGLGIDNLGLNNYKAAKRIINKLEKNDNELISKGGEFSELWYIFFSLQVAIAEKNHKKIQALTKVVIERIINSYIFSDFTREVCEVCHYLIKMDELKIAKQIIDAIKKNNTEYKFHYLGIIIADLNIAYYKATNNKKMAMKAYEDRHKYENKQIEVKKTVYYESIELMHLLNELRDEGIKTRLENRILQEKAETDILTGLPNRYALNRNIEAAYIRA